MTLTPFVIAVLGYGSAPNELSSNHYQATLEVVPTKGVKPQAGNLHPHSPFVLAEGLTLPIRLGRKSSGNTNQRRITLVIAEEAPEVPVLYARSRFTDLGQALKNLAAREGCGKSTKFMGFVDVVNQLQQARLPAVAEKIKAWAIANHFNAVIWADFPEKEFPQGKEKEILLADRVLLTNTKHYIRSLPLPLTSIQQEILALPESHL